MREQVIVLPPSVERRQASFSLSKKEEALLHTSQEIRNWAVSEEENAQQLTSFAFIERDHKEVIHAGLVSAENMKPHISFALIERDHKEVFHAELASTENVKPQDAKEALVEPFRGSCEDVKQAKACAEGSLAPERMRNSPSSNGEGPLLLQWGQRKRSRCSRADNHNPGSQVDNHNLKPGGLTNESSVLFRKTVRIQADRATAVQPNTSSHASKGTFKAKNGVVAERKDFCSDEKQNQQAKVLKGGPSDAKQSTTGSPFREGKRGYPSLHKQGQSLQKSKTCTLADPKPPPKDQCVIPLLGTNNASPSQNELVWPKLVIGLSRKEKEEDFLVLKGTKLPQRPKRRPKVVERALHYCSPGSWLVDISPSRYDVREKKRARKRPRGLKAMESWDSDLD